MSNFVKHSPCPFCGSRDNQGIWDDGHTFCFGCGFVERLNGKSIGHITKKLSKQSTNNNTNDGTSNDYLALPSDITWNLPPKAITWLTKYQLTKDEIYIKNNFSWSEEKQQLIYSVFDPSGNLLLWQGRYFGSAPRHPKYITQGNVKDTIHLINPTTQTVVLVEDVISAIKVGRHTTVSPLFGSTLSPTRAIRLSALYANLILWLDKDKVVYSIKQQPNIAPYFNSVSCIVSDLDPKEYNDAAILRFLDSKR